MERSVPCVIRGKASSQQPTRLYWRNSTQLPCLRPSVHPSVPPSIHPTHDSGSCPCFFLTFAELNLRVRSSKSAWLGYSRVIQGYLVVAPNGSRDPCLLSALHFAWPTTSTRSVTWSPASGPPPSKLGWEGGAGSGPGPCPALGEWGGGISDDFGDFEGSEVNLTTPWPPCFECFACACVLHVFAV